MKHRFNPGPGDASQYADDFASNVSWSPMDTQSVLLRRRLVSLGPLALTFSLPSSLKILMAVMPVLITLPMILVVNTWHRFAFIAPFILIPGTSQLGTFSIARRPGPCLTANLGPSGKAQANPGTRAVELADNHALQLISFFYSDGDPKSAGVVYQLNAVLSE